MPDGRLTAQEWWALTSCVRAHTLTKRKCNQTCVALSFCFFFSCSISVCVETCTYMRMCGYVWSSFIIEGLLYARRAHSHPLSSVSSSYRSTINPDTQGHACLCVCDRTREREKRSCGRVCVCAWCGCMCVCVVQCVPLLLICVLDFLILNPIWDGQVGQCLLHDTGNCCQKRICTVDHSKYVSERRLWLQYGGVLDGALGELYLFLFNYLFTYSRCSKHV